ncbi:MAG: phosphoglucosamine mutase [Spirochaetia bacterium]|nr:phosphoglucosamine mutase [Spirochaetia bacterium]
MISVSGIRGTIPEGLNPSLIADIALGFAATTGKRVVLGMDSRNTGPLIRDLIASTLIACGKQVLDAELAPTPTVKAAVKLHNASGGIMISASHNPPQWNGLKLIANEGFFFQKEDLNSMLAAIKSSKFPLVDYKNLGSYKKVEAVQDHIKSVLKLISNTEQIRSKKYTVVVDAVAGAGRNALPLLLAELGCKVIPLYCDADTSGEFPRPPEPTPVALKKFSETLRKSKAACGFALDPDADRIVPGSPAKGAINEEYSLPLSFLGLPEVKVKPKARPRGKIPFVVNLSTSTLLDQIAEPYGYAILRSAVGEANVVAMMQKNSSFFGGEGNGGIIHSKVPSFGRDSLLGAALMLSAMARHDARSLDDLMGMLPPLFMEKRKFDLKQGADVREVFTRIENLFSGMNVDRRDGLHLANADCWIHVRASNTEPVLRVIAEARNTTDLTQLLSRAARAIK